MDTLKRIDKIIQQNAYQNLILDALKRIEKIIQENSLEQKKKKTLNLITGKRYSVFKQLGPVVKTDTQHRVNLKRNHLLANLYKSFTLGWD